MDPVGAARELRRLSPREFFASLDNLVISRENSLEWRVKAENGLTSCKALSI
jgi:hypothetical protein